jgi:catalase
MARKNRKTPAAGKAAARSTVSGPPQGPRGAGDRAVRKMQGTQALASAFPFNANKPAEIGDAARKPKAGATAQPPDPTATGSTLTEATGSPKTGTRARPGFNPGNDPLDRVRVDSGGQTLTTNFGQPIADNQNSLKAGFRGPALLEDFILREKITHFDHERIPERIVHARGSAAHGFFECYEPLTRYTRASFLSAKGKRTPVFVRFSTVAGERGSTDVARDIRGFATKFYTDEGNFDIVGNNIPVFFIQDAMKFPDLVHAVKPEPHHGMPQAASAHDTF